MTRGRVAQFILLSPAIPYFSFGWGTNIPFFVASCLYLLTRKWRVSPLAFLQESKVYLLFLSLPLIFIAYSIFAGRLNIFDLTLPLLGARELGTSAVILLACYAIKADFGWHFTARALLLGFFINAAYGAIEVCYPQIASFDYLFHERNKNMDYLYKEEFTRVRLLFLEPAQASMYLIAILPIIILMCRGKAQVITLAIWGGAFMKVASKGTLFFLIPSLCILAMLHPLGLGKIIVRYAHAVLFMGLALLILGLSLESELSQTWNYTVDILVVGLNGIVNSRDFVDFIVILNDAGVSSSQYVRLILTVSAVRAFFIEPFTLITGFSPWGSKFYFYLYPELLPDFVHHLSRLTSYSRETISGAKHIVQSAFLESYVSFGLPALLFMIACFHKGGRLLLKASGSYRIFSELFLLWLGLCATFMWYQQAFSLVYLIMLTGICWHEKREADAFRVEHCPTNLT